MKKKYFFISIFKISKKKKHFDQTNKQKNICQTLQFLSSAKAAQIDLLDC